MYECEIWSLTLREERKMRVFENIVLRRIFGSRRDEEMGKWRRLHNEELNDLYSSPNIVRVIKSRRMRWARHVARMGEERGVYRVLVGKPEGKRPLGRPRRRWVDNVRMDLQEVGSGYMDWTGLAQDRDRWRTLVSAVMNLRFPWNVGNFLTSCKPVSCSRGTLHHGVSKKNSVRYYRKCISVCMQSARYSCPISMKREFIRNIFRKMFQISWKSVQWEPSCSMRRNGQTWRS